MDKTKKPRVKKGLVSNNGDYSVSIKYSKTAVKDKLIKFTVNKGNSFEISTDKLIELVAHYVNSDVLAPMFVDTERINVVYVTRALNFRADKDIKEGETFQMYYEHPYPIEFALIEEGMGMALINKEKMGFVVTPEMLKDVKAKESPEAKTFIRKFYESFRNIGKKKELGSDT